MRECVAKRLRLTNFPRRRRRRSRADPVWWEGGMNTVGLLQRRRNHRSFRVPIARVQGCSPSLLHIGCVLITNAGRRRHFISRFILLRKARQKAAARLANTAEASRRESFTTEENTEAAQIDVQDAHAVDDDLQQQPEGKKLSELDAKLSVLVVVVINFSG